MKNCTTGTYPIEESYFHTGDSGITARIIETVRQYESDEQYKARLDSEKDQRDGLDVPSLGILNYNGRKRYSYKFEFVHGAQGHSSTMSTPLISPDQIDIYIEMLTRLKDRIEKYPDYKPAHEIRESDRRRIVKMKNGYTLEEVWSPEIVVSQWSTSSMFLGHNLLDCGVVVGFEPYRGVPIERGASGTGGSPYYRYEDIGKKVEEARCSDDYDPSTAFKRSEKGNGVKTYTKQSITSATIAAGKLGQGSITKLD